MLFPNAAITDDIGCFIRKPIEEKALVKHAEEELN